jgi:mannose-6-phosphate isomerase-like protein (cupin superfamily)
MKRRDFLSLCVLAGTATPQSLIEAQETLVTPSPAKPDSIKSEENVEKTDVMIVTPAQAKVYSQGLGEAHILVDGERSGGAWWLGEFLQDPGFKTPLHFHYQQNEQFYVLDGVLSVYVEGKWTDLEAGTFATVPHGIHHAQGNLGTKPVRFLGSGNPAGFEHFFAELDKLTARLRPSDPQFGAEVAKILVRFDTKPLGPAPPRT